VFEAVAIQTLTYGCEVWVLPEREKSRLQATEMRMLRKIAGVSRLEEYHTGPDQLKDMILILSYNGGCMQNQAKT